MELDKLRGPGTAGLLVIVLFAFIGLYFDGRPSPKGENAPEDVFSAARAMKHLEIIASEPHPGGTPAHKRVADYLVDQFNSLGLEVQEQSSLFTYSAEETRFATPNRNIMARLKGTSSQETLLVMAHYDTRAKTAGAGDNSAAVAAMLETIRAVKAGDPLKNDVIFLCSDNEEYGLIGARQFTEEHPWAQEVDLVVNWEGRGNNGPVVMFETNGDNSWIIDEFAAAASSPVSTSFSDEIYKRMPNATDFTVLMELDGVQGLNFAFLGGPNYYHAGGDTPANLGKGTLQHQGDLMLQMVKHFGNVSVNRESEGDLIHFTMPFFGLISYSPGLVMPLLGFSVVLFIAALVLGFRAGNLTIKGFIAGFFLDILLLVAGILFAVFLWKLFTAFGTPNMDPLAGHPYRTNGYFYGYLFSCSALMLMLAGWFRKKIKVENLAMGGLLLWLVLGFLVSTSMAGGSYLFVLPLLFMLIGVVITISGKEEDEPRKALLRAVFGIPCMLVYLPLVSLLYLTLPYAPTVPIPAILSGLLCGLLVLLLLAPLLWSLPENLFKWFPRGLALVGFVTLLSLNVMNSSYSAAAPLRESLMYVADRDSGTHLWASTVLKLGQWNGPLFQKDRKREPLPLIFPESEEKILQAPAPASDVPGATIELVSQESKRRRREIRVRVTPPEGAFGIILMPEGDFNRAELEGKPMGSGFTMVQYLGVGPEGFEFSCRVAKSKPFKLRAISIIPELPEDLLPEPRPDWVIPNTGMTDYLEHSTLVNTSLTVPPFQEDATPEEEPEEGR
ncbi:MAG: M28 family peptidase [Acidobacteriota bacterium]|nr:M28 family peptidase [Acidobacteriota bacterium]